MEQFLGSRVYAIPCGSVRKGDDPHGRIVRDYSFAPAGGKSINESLQDNSEKYIAFKERIRALLKVS